MDEGKMMKYQKLSFVFSVISACCTAVVMVVVLIAAFKLFPMVDDIYTSAMVSLENLETLTEELKEADLAGTVSDLNGLTKQAAGDLTDAMKKLNSIDVEKLNQAIANLNATVEPLAKLFGG